MITVVNYGIGNLDSVVRAFRRCGAEVAVSSDPGRVAGSSGIVLPGVGSFDEAMNNLNASGKAFASIKLPYVSSLIGQELFLAMLTVDSRLIPTDTSELASIVIH